MSQHQMLYIQWESYPWFSEFVGGVQDSSQDLKCVCIIECLKIPMLLRSSSYDPHHRHHFLSRKNPGAPSLSEQTNEPFSRIHRPKGPERTAILLQLPQIHSNPIVRRICFQNYLAANPGNPLDSFQTLDLWKSSEWGDMIPWIFFFISKRVEEIIDIEKWKPNTAACSHCIHCLSALAIHQVLVELPKTFKLRIDPTQPKRVGGWTNPFEKYARQNGAFPQVEVKKKIIETTTQKIIVLSHVEDQQRCYSSRVELKYNSAKGVEKNFWAVCRCVQYST